MTTPSTVRPPLLLDLSQYRHEAPAPSSPRTAIQQLITRVNALEQTVAHQRKMLEQHTHTVYVPVPSIGTAFGTACSIAFPPTAMDLMMGKPSSTFRYTREPQ